jgi:hypothetical protein
MPICLVPFPLGVLSKRCWSMSVPGLVVANIATRPLYLEWRLRNSPGGVGCCREASGLPYPVCTEHPLELNRRGSRSGVVFKRVFQVHQSRPTRLEPGAACRGRVQTFCAGQLVWLRTVGAMAVSTRLRCSLRVRLSQVHSLPYGTRGRFSW